MKKKIGIENNNNKILSLVRVRKHKYTQSIFIYIYFYDYGKTLSITFHIPFYFIHDAKTYTSYVLLTLYHSNYKFDRFYTYTRDDDDDERTEQLNEHQN